MANEARVAACKKVWEDLIERHGEVKKYAYKYVYSLDPRFCELMVAAGKDIDALLIHGSRGVMRNFQEKYYPDDKVGYLVGIHHDRQHIHAHLLLFPYTANGVPLRVTDEKIRDPNGRFAEFRKVANKHVRDYFTREFDRPTKASDPGFEQVMQTRMVSSIASKGFPKTQVAAADRFQWLAEEKRRLQALADAELRQLLVKRLEALLKMFQPSRDGDESRAGEYKDMLTMNGRSQVELKQKLEQLEGVIKAARAKQDANRQEFNTAQKALTNCRYYSAHARGHGTLALEAETREERKWLTDLMANPALAATARTALTKQPLGEVGCLRRRQRGLQR